jgi:hypothetical protein
MEGEGRPPRVGEAFFGKLNSFSRNDKGKKFVMFEEASA